MTDEHIAQMALDRARARPESIAFRVKKNDAYVDVPWSTVIPRIEHIAAGLLTSAPLSEGARISIMGNTSMDWVVLDIAALSVGLQTVPVYASLLPEEAGYMHVDTGVELIVVENADQLAKVRKFRDGFTFFDKKYVPADIKNKAKVVVVNPSGLTAADDWESLETVESRGKARLDEMKAEMERRSKLIRRNHIATFTYTSGTTGPPKAVIQTHHNMLSMLENIEEVGIFEQRVRDHGLFLFLPLAHSFGRLIELAGPFFNSPLVMSTVPTLAVDLGLSRPGFFPGAPRVYEKMMGKVFGAIESAPPLRQKIFHWAMDVGKQTIPYVSTGQPIPAMLSFKRSIADKLVLSKIRAKLGMDRAAVLLSGSAPLRSDVHEAFLAFGLMLIEAYGLTETCPGLTANRPGRLRVGTVGQPIKGVEIRIAEDNEILAKGPNITSGYLNRDDATKDAFDSDGWFHTGDLGSQDSEGFVRITGRKKELLKTSGGKYIAPVKIEALLKAMPFIQEAVVIGDNRNYCTCLFSLDPENFGEWIKRTGAPNDVNSDHVKKELDAHVKKVNGTLASYESIKYFRVLPGPMTVDGGELTASLKVKRKVVSEKYAGLIEEMYSKELAAASKD